MVKVATRFTYSDTPKGIVKHAANKARRRQDVGEVIDSTDLTEILEARYIHFEPVARPVTVVALLVWDSGLDYDLDGTAYQDDAPGYFPHSYHLTKTDAQAEACWLEHTGTDPLDLHIATDYLVPEWDTHRVPTR